MHLPAQISDLAMILAVAAIVTFLFQKIRQPLVLGYLIAGVIVGPYTPTGLTVSDIPNVKVWAELGVIFLMFSLGLEFTFHKLVRVGVTAAGTSVIEVVLMVALGYGTGRLLGWSSVDSVFLGGMLSISSTTIIIKAFDELRLRTRRFAEIVFGVLIVEDLVAILLLVALSTVAVTQSFLSMELVTAALKLVFIVGSWFLVGYFVIPSFLRYAAKLLDDETLTVLSAGLCLILVVVATRYEYSPALGAFIMGSILAETSEAHRIERLIQPLKNIFAAVFFVSVGMLVDPRALLQHWPAVLTIALVTVIGKVFSTTAGALLTGQPLKRSIQIGFSLAQIGEFSFIIATLGSHLKVTSEFLYPIAVTVSVITTFTTPYLIRLSEPFAEWLERRLPAGITRRLTDYSTWVQTPRGDIDLRRVLLRRGLQFFLNGIAVSLLFLAALEWAIPSLDIAPVIAWSAAIILSAPFVWGMYFSFNDANLVFYAFLAKLATVVWIGVLSALILPLGLSLVITLAATTLVFLMLYRRLEMSYRWFEGKFLQNLKGSEGEDKSAELSTLAPWDVHAVKLTLHQNSALVGKTLKEANIRTSFGLNIVAIQRGEKVIASPTAEDRLFPRDELMVVGTDEQIDRFRALAELPSGDIGDGKKLHEYFLRRVRIDGASPFIGQSIRNSGLRERLHGLVVGLERGILRTLNPDPVTVLQPGDVLWVVNAPT